MKKTTAIIAALCGTTVLGFAGGFGDVAIPSGSAALSSGSTEKSGDCACSGLTGELYAGYATEYVFRGIELGDDLVEAGVDLTYQTPWGVYLTGGAWTGHFDTVGGDHEEEIDYYAGLGYDLKVGETDLTLEAGYTWYNYPSNGDSNTEEVYISAGAHFFGYDMGLTYYLDADNQDVNGLTELTASKTFGLTECIGVGLDLLVGYAVEEGNFTHAGAKVSLPYSLNDYITVSPYAAYTLELADLSTALNNGWDADNQFVSGVSISASF